MSESVKSSKASNSSINGSTKASVKEQVSVATTGTDPSGNLKYTPMDEIPKGVKHLVDTYHEKHKLHSLQYRLNQIRNVYFAIKDNVDALCEALEQDFYRSPSETKNMEASVLLNEIVHTMSNLYKWSQPEKISHKTTNVATCPVYVERIPFGVVLVISPFNYPLLLCVSSVIGALAAGNSVVLKQSESTPRFSQLVTDLLTEALDDDIFYCVNGAIPETTKLLDQKFDKIIYTGNPVVGTIIAKKAAETLTPVILELGGKSPGIVLEDLKDKHLAATAKRILWGKYTNNGQTCVAVDYVLVHESVKPKLMEHLLKYAEEFFGDIDEKSPNFTHMIHDRAYNNLNKTLQDTDGKVVYGGKTDATTRFISPTIIDNVKWSDSTMRQELFGPLLPIITYTDLKDAMNKVVKSHDCPLAQYIFTSGATSRAKNPAIDLILTYLRSGGTIINDTLVHVGLPNAPFGGIGGSGNGSYHGWYSFRNFTHERTTIEQELWNDAILKSRYPPYHEKKDQIINVTLSPQHIWFGRTGDVNVTGPSTFFNIWSGIAGMALLGYYVVANR